jgi:autotransporter-associated beta strand protein
MTAAATRRHSRLLLPSLAVVVSGALGSQSLWAQTPANCPGVIISEVPAPTQIFGNPINPRYVSDPCILVLSNGHYLATHALFGSASGSDTNGRTSIFRSTNQGVSWTKVNNGNDLNGVLRGSLFEQAGTVYLLGANNDSSGNAAVISRSTNGGTTWTAPASLSPRGGLATPDNVLTVNGRLWLARTTSAFSAATNADPLLPASWSNPGGFPAASSAWLPGTGFNTTNNFIGEGQMTHSPGEGLVVLPKVRLLSYTALARVNPVSGLVAFDPERDFVPLPGGEKKFGVRYDPVSGKYFLLSNPILPADAGSTLARDLIRNTAAVFSSTDLRNWKLEKIFLYTANINYEGFQYFNFEFDGNDIVLVSRTGFDIGGNRPPRGHDSNLLTFHRIPSFRSLTRDLYLRITGGQVRRFERTQHTDAPLGVFARGSSFAGQPLTNPNGMGVDGSGVYIRESGGRILRFDLSGNFLGTVTSAPVALQSADLNIPAAAGGEATWNLSGSGSWADPQSWQDWNVPGAPADVAVFGSAATGNATVTLASSPVAWAFDTAGNFEGWATTNVDSPAVAGGVLSGIVQTNNDPYITRANLSFRGNDATQVRIRMKVNASGNVPVDVYWGTSSDDTFSATRQVRVNYTGNGDFQDVVFNMSGVSGWAGERVTRLRIDPSNGPFTGRAFEIDSISVPLPNDATRLAGLRFLGPVNYTISGSGSLALSGSARLEAAQGSHTVSLPVQLTAVAVASINSGATLTLSGPLSGSHALTKEGGGTLSLAGTNTRSGATTVSAGTLAINSAQLDGNVLLTTGAVLQLNFAGTDSVGELWLDGERKWRGIWGGLGSGATYRTSAISGTGTLNVTSGPDPGFDGWAWQRGLTGAPGLANGTNDNPDNDSLPNVFEWVLGGNPLAFDPPAVSPRLTTSGANYVFTFSREDASEAAAPLVVQHSTNLAGWIDVPIGATSSGPNASGVTVTVTENGALPDTIAVTFPPGTATQNRLLFRLKAAGF